MSSAQAPLQHLILSLTLPCFTHIVLGFTLFLALLFFPILFAQLSMSFPFIAVSSKIFPSMLPSSLFLQILFLSLFVIPIDSVTNNVISNPFHY